MHIVRAFEKRKRNEIQKMFSGLKNCSAITPLFVLPPPDVGVSMSIPKRSRIVFLASSLALFIEFNKTLLLSPQNGISAINLYNSNKVKSKALFFQCKKQHTISLIILNNNLHISFRILRKKI